LEFVNFAEIECEKEVEDCGDGVTPVALVGVVVRIGCGIGVAIGNTVWIGVAETGISVAFPVTFTGIEESTTGVEVGGGGGGGSELLIAEAIVNP